MVKFKVGQIYFWKDIDSLFGKAINYYNLKTFKQSETTHCGIVSRIFDDKIEIFEATNKGFISSFYYNDWLENKIKIGKVKFKETKIQLKNVFDTCKKYENIKYGWLDIIGIVLSSLFKWKVLGITGKNAIICSEAVARILYDCSDKKIVLGYSKNNYNQSEYKIKFDAITPMHIYLSKCLK